MRYVGSYFYSIQLTKNKKWPNMCQFILTLWLKMTDAHLNPLRLRTRWQDNTWKVEIVPKTKYKYMKKKKEAKPYNTLQSSIQKGSQVLHRMKQRTRTTERKKLTFTTTKLGSSELGLCPQKLKQSGWWVIAIQLKPHSINSKDKFLLLQSHDQGLSPPSTQTGMVCKGRWKRSLGSVNS